MSVKENRPAASIVFTPSGLPFGDSASVRVTVTPVPAASGRDAVSEPETVMVFARAAVAGTLTVSLGSDIVGSVSTTSRYVLG